MNRRYARAIAVLGIASSAASATTFSAFFNNGTGQNGDHHAFVYAWKAAIGTSALIDDSLAIGRNKIRAGHHRLERDMVKLGFEAYDGIFQSYPMA